LLHPNIVLAQLQKVIIAFLPQKKKDEPQVECLAIALSSKSCSTCVFPSIDCSSAMPRKPLDPRIPTLIANSVQSHTRSFFLIVGSQKQQNLQITNLHYLLSQARLNSGSAKKARPNVLWCYKKELGFTSNRKKREAKVKRDVKRGIRDQDELDPFELFVGVTDIRYW
jgi:hypothetical protein